MLIGDSMVVGAAGAAMISPSTAAALHDGCALLFDLLVREAEVDLAGTVAPQLAAERALHHDVVAGELGTARRDGALAALATDDIVRGLDRSLLAVVHAHGTIVGKERANLRMEFGNPLQVLEGKAV